MIKQFQMSRYEILGLAIDQNEKFNPKSTQHTGDVESAIKIAPHKTDARRWTISLKVELHPSKGAETDFFPYHVSVRARGYCVFREAPTQEDVEQTLRLNGASILYGLMRAQVAQITAQSTHGQFLLPVLNFVEIESLRVNGTKRALPPPKAEEKSKA